MAALIGAVMLGWRTADRLPHRLRATLALVAALVMVWAWPRLAATLLLYGVLARVPVVAVTWLALQNGWDTHYTKLPAGTTLPAGASLFGYLATPQLTFWIVTTLMIGGLCGCLGAALARRKQS